MWIDNIPVGRVLSSTSAVLEVHAIHSDHLNTPRALVNAQAQGGQAAGTVVWRWKLNSASATGSNAFGAQPADENPDGNGTTVRFDLRFPGQQWDAAVGVSYNYFRYYESATGRYVESDPIGLKGGKNTYVYVSGRPLRFIDPLGLFECCDNPVYDAVLNVQEMSDRFHEIRVWGHTKFPGHENSYMRHCTASCVLADEFGVAAAWAAGVGNEYQGFYFHDAWSLPETFNNKRPWAFDPNDLSSNEVGFSCSRGKCDQRSPGDDSFKECEKCCALGVMYGR